MDKFDTKMRIVHIFSDEPLTEAIRLIELQSKDHHVEIIDMSKGDIRYDEVIDTIFSCDEVISW